MLKKFLTKKILPVAIVFAVSVMLCVPVVLAQDGAAPDITGELERTGAQFGAVEGEQDLPTIIGNIIRVVLAFMGIVLLIVVLYGGFLWMTAGGSEEKVEKAKNWIINGIIGLVIVLVAYAITSYVVGQLTTSVLGMP